MIYLLVWWAFLFDNFGKFWSKQGQKTGSTVIGVLKNQMYNEMQCDVFAKK